MVEAPTFASLCEVPIYCGRPRGNLRHTMVDSLQPGLSTIENSDWRPDSLTASPVEKWTAISLLRIVYRNSGRGHDLVGRMQ